MSSLKHAKRLLSMMNLDVNNNQTDIKLSTSAAVDLESARPVSQICQIFEHKCGSTLHSNGMLNFSVEETGEHQPANKKATQSSGACR